MQLSEFREFVTARAEWFRGRHPETEDSVERAESALGLRLPPSLKWLLTEWGYWHATGIDSLDGSVSKTVEWRSAVRLPSRFMLLRDLGDAGVILLEMADAPSVLAECVIWFRAEDVARLGYEVIRPEPGYSYASFADYVVARFGDSTEDIAPEHVRLDPSWDR